MKTTKITFLCTLFSLITLGGCSTNQTTKININVGTKMTEGIDLSYMDLVSLLESKQNEDLLLATYSTRFSTHCSCWRNFNNDIISMYMKTYNVPIYIFDTDKLDGHENKYGISEITPSGPDFYLFKGKKKIKRYRYSDKGNNIIKSYPNFKTEMEKMIVKPETFHIYTVNEAYLDEHLPTDDKTVLYVGRNGCGDCSYVLPNVLIPYINNNELKQDILLLDIQSYRNADTESYNAVKAKYNLTSDANHIFGFDTGVVPTFQYYEKGVLKDADVFFNDTIEKVDNVWKITNSYYTTERLENLNFLKNSSVPNKVLEGLTIPEEDLQTTPYEGQTYTSWSQEGAAKMHTPILQQFFNTYCL